MERTALVAAVAAFVSLASAASAQDTEIGRETYAQFCATCHGANGAGNGPLTELITAQVPDLTTLAQRNEAEAGKFPMLDVIHVIDGRTGLRAHGGPMPVYGALFREEGAAGQPYGDVLYSRGKVLSLAYYLESIQQ